MINPRVATTTSIRMEFAIGNFGMSNWFATCRAITFTFKTVPYLADRMPLAMNFFEEKKRIMNKKNANSFSCNKSKQR